MHLCSHGTTLERVQTSHTITGSTAVAPRVATCPRIRCPAAYHACWFDVIRRGRNSWAETSDRLSLLPTDRPATMLKTIKILRDRVENWDAYPFSVAAIRSLNEIKLRSKVCLFAGENGTGKSSLLEAIAAHYGFGREGGNRNFGNDSTETNHSVDPLVRALRLSFDRRTGAGYFLRAESWFNTVSFMDKLDEEPSESPPISTYYGGHSLHTRSHGETFFTLLDLKFRRNGLFLLDEPEAALSPQRQLSFLVLVHDVLQKYKDAQFIISTHSSIILGYPDAQILSFDGGKNP
jgi:predicted ATPase